MGVAVHVSEHKMSLLPETKCSKDLTDIIKVMMELVSDVDQFER